MVCGLRFTTKLPVRAFRVRHRSDFGPVSCRGWKLVSTIVHRVSSSLLGPVVPPFRALSGRLKGTVRRHKFNKDSLSKTDFSWKHAKI